jgi:DNA-binding CsgD family transcriptional regulator
LWLQLCQTDREREVVRLRLLGYTDKEVGLQLGLSQPAIVAVRQALQSRYIHVNR